MAGLGKRLRPFTLTTPKPLLKLAGKSIVQRLVDKINSSFKEKITDIAFIIGDFPQEVVENLQAIGNSMNVKTHIYVQTEALGTAHALNFAKEILKGQVIVAYADTLFEANFNLDKTSDVVIWTKKVANPELYGVVLKENDVIKTFVEKPKTFVSDEAIIGIYYFKNAEFLANKINYIIENDLKENNEYQLTNALQMLLEDKLVFKSQVVDEWLDCGNKEMLISTNSFILKTKQYTSSKNISIDNCSILEPVYFGNNIKICNSVIGPNVSIEDNSKINSSVIDNSIVYSSTSISGLSFSNSIIGKNCKLNASKSNLAFGDYVNAEI